MKTRLTDGQLMATLKLLEQKGVTPERFQALLASGILADLLEFASEKHARFGPGYMLWLRNFIRMPLGLHVKGMRATVIYNCPLTDLIDRNKYHTVRYTMTECGLADISTPSVAKEFEEVTFETIDAGDWKSYTEMEDDLRNRKLRIATPRELICFDGELPFVAIYLPLCVYAKVAIAGGESPLRVMVAANQKPGLERALSFYPGHVPDRLKGQRLLVVPIE